MWIWPSLLLALATPGPQAAPPLAPSGKWMVDFAEKMCILQRAFGEGEAKATFGLRPPTLGSRYEVLVMTPDTPGSRVRRGSARMWLTPAGEAIETDYVSYPTDSGRLTSFYADWSEMSALTTSETVRIEAGDLSVAIAPTQVAPALEVLDSCRADLLESYGLDTAALAAVAEPAKAAEPEAYWVSTDDYPMDAIRAGEKGTVEILWTIGIDGSITGCEVLVSSGHRSLDDAACGAIERRGRYRRPALDKTGKPVVSWESRRVRWDLP